MNVSATVEGGPRRPRIVQCSRQIAPGGGVSGVAAQIEAGFRAAGYDCRRVTLETVGVSSHRLYRSRVVNKLALIRDVVWYTIAGTVYARMRYAGRRNIILCHNDALVGDIYVNHGIHKLAVLGSRPLAKMLRNPLHLFIYLREEARHRLRLHRRIVTLSPADTEAIVAAYPASRGRVVELANAVDVSRFAAAAARRGEVREAMGVREDEIVLLFVGHEFDRKGLYYIIRALGQLDERHRLWVVGGDDSMISAARNEAARAGVDDRTTFFGTQRERVEDYFAGADVFVLASSYEVTPLVLLEAMAAAVVPVCTPVGVAPEIIKPGVNGFLVERDESSIAAGISAATQDRQRLTELSKLAAESAKPFDWPAVVRGYLELITSVHAEKSTR